MLAIKLQRKGKKHQPSYRIVVAEKRSKMGGPPVEDLGSYNPFTKAMNVTKERIAHWIERGAQPTITVHNLLVKGGVLQAPKRAVKMNKPKAAEAVTEEAPAAEAAAPETVAEAAAETEAVAEAPTEAPTETPTE